MKKGLLVSLSLVCISILLSGCDTFRNTLGLDHYQADAFAVVENPPLSMPPDYKLRPPREKSEEKSPSSSVKTQKIMFGKEESAQASQSKAVETDILKQAGGNAEVSSDIRKIVDEEAKQEESVGAKLSHKLKKMKDEAAQNLSLSKSKTESKEKTS